MILQTSGSHHWRGRVSSSNAAPCQATPLISQAEIKRCAPCKSTLKGGWPSCSPQLERRLVKSMLWDYKRTTLLLFMSLVQRANAASVCWNKADLDHKIQIVTDKLPTSGQSSNKIQLLKRQVQLSEKWINLSHSSLTFYSMWKLSQLKKTKTKKAKPKTPNQLQTSFLLNTTAGFTKIIVETTGKLLGW